MNEDKTTALTGASSVQRSEEKSSRGKKEDSLEALRKDRMAIKEGHLTGGYCDTEKLLAVEKKIHDILSTQLEEAKKKHGYSPDPKFKHPEVRRIELELYGLAFKPRYVVAE